jgi:hypothetical protein
LEIEDAGNFEVSSNCGYSIEATRVGEYDIEIASRNVFGASAAVLFQGTEKAELIDAVSDRRRWSEPEVDSLPPQGTDVFGDEIVQWQIGSIGGIRAPYFHRVAALDEAADVVIEGAFASTAGQVVPDSDLHVRRRPEMC